MVPLVAFGSNDLGGEFSQSDSLLTHVLGGIIVTEPCICWESGCDVWILVSATHSFSHAKILTVLIILHVALCCIRPVELHLLHYDAIGRYRLSCLLHYQHAFLHFRRLTSQTFVVPVIPMMVFGSNDLGGEFSQSDSLLTHALVGIPGITGTPWIKYSN